MRSSTISAMPGDLSLVLTGGYNDPDYLVTKPCPELSIFKPTRLSASTSHIT
ncbi:MAG: hypothetical protein QXS23_02430 [Desulfurococcaceae archaeon]